MSDQRIIDWRLLIGLVASLLLHVAAGAFIGLGGFEGLDDDSAALPPDPEEPQIRPGVDRSRAVTISWIGFEEPTPHQAKLANVDQPALTRGPAPQPNPEQSASAPPSTPSITPKPLSEAADAQPLPAIPLPSRSLDELLAQLEQAVPAAEPAPEPAPAPQPTEPERTVDDAPQPASQPGGGPRESPPASRVKPREIVPGEPVAMEGVRINTVSPRFTTITRLTAAPSNPLVRITFDASGKVVLAEIIESSGYRNVDRPVLDAIYAWRAGGEKLEELRKKKPDERIVLDFRIVLR